MTGIEIINLNKDSLIELSLLMAWRSNPLIYKWFLSQTNHLIWEIHYQFLTSVKNRYDYLVYLNGRPIGHVALSNTEQIYPEISIMIGETSLWGKGISYNVLSAFLIMLKELGFDKLSARISDDNISSIKLFNRSGFYLVGSLPNITNWSLYYYDSSL